MSTCALPDELRSWAGEIVDVDSHEMMPAQVWRREFGAREPLTRQIDAGSIGASSCS